MASSLSISSSPTGLHSAHRHFADHPQPSVTGESVSLTSAPRKTRTHKRASYQHHDRQRDCFEILQTIVQEIERRERQESDAAIGDIPEIIIKRRAKVPSILIKPPSFPSCTTTTAAATTPTVSTTFTPPSSSVHRNTRSVHFAPEPPKVFRK